MISYPLPPDLTTRGQFRQLVAALHYHLTKNGLDPAFKPDCRRFREVLDDGRAMACFAVFVSEAAEQVLQEP